MKIPTRPASGQRGAVLIAALIFLVILTLLGTTGVMNNALQERMAGNARNRDLAFQSAEHALEAADLWIKTQTRDTLKTALDPNGDGNYADQVANDGIRPSGELHDNDATYWRTTFDWTSTDLRSATGANLSNVAAQAHYIVEKLPSYTAPGPPPVIHDFYRVTARGVGGVGDSGGSVAPDAVILQAIYEFQ
jgi:type IV pilus assembly protein PilX